MATVLIIVIAALFVVAAAELFADRIGIAAPILLLLLGGAVALIPGMPEVEVEPDLVLMIILPPLLYSSAVNMPVSDFRRNLAPISVLAVVLVAISAAVVGFFVDKMVPGIGIAAAIALGAIVSPTDAVATSIVKEAGVSRRVVAVLNGEGLINDASALVILGSAVGAMTSQISAGKVVLDFVLAVVVAVIVGWLVGRLMIWLRSKVREATPDTLLSLATPFLAFLPAEHLHGSGLVAAVVAGLVVSHQAPRKLTPTQRTSSQATWNALMLMLESAVFLLMGLELTAIVEDLEADSFGWKLAVAVAAVALATTLVVRSFIIAALLAWVARRSKRRSEQRDYLERASKRINDATSISEVVPITGPAAAQRLSKLRHRLSRSISDLDYHIEHPLGPREGTVMIWAGMRGAITLAAAQTLPLNTPHRSFLVFVAFLVAAASLLIQGGTLGLVVRLVKPAEEEGIDPEEEVEIRELMRRAARSVPTPPAITELLEKQDGFEPGEENEAHERAMSLALRERLQASPEHRRLFADLSREYAVELIIAQREALLDANDEGSFNPDAVGAALDRLDADQIALETRTSTLN